MVGSTATRAICAGCAFLLTWLSSYGCLAQSLPAAALRTQLPVVANLSYADVRTGAPAPSLKAPDTWRKPWLWAMASTSAAFAVGFASSEGLAYRTQSQYARALERSRDLTLELGSRTRADGQSDSAARKLELLDRISSVCLAGSVATAGAALLIWLTSKRARADHQQPKLLLGPMVLRGVSGGGLALRQKF
jgi:hypothetical protein